MTVLIRNEGRFDPDGDGESTIVEPPAPPRGDGVNIPLPSSRRRLAGSSGGVMTRRRSSMIQIAQIQSLFETNKTRLAFTTEEIHSVDKTTEFYGPYAHLRKMLDYTHYKNYTQQRQWLQDAIIEDLVDHIDGLDDNSDICITPTEPWLIFTVGVRGAGKAHTMRELVQERKIPLLSYVPVDRDYIRRRLPEYAFYGQSDGESDFDVNYMTRKEASLISELVLLAALQNGRNVVFDSAMRDTDWFISIIDKLKKTCRQEYLGIMSTLKVGLIEITAPNEEILKRANISATITGRVIPEYELLSALDTIAESVHKVLPYMDFHCKIRNNKNSYECDNIDEVYEIVSENGEMNWETIHRTFSQSCAWSPAMKGKTPRRTASNKISNNDSNGDDFQPSLLHSKLDHRPFDVLISSEENNKSDDMRFYGKYAHLRRNGIDYSYHSNYTFERQKLQDAIIDSMLDAVIIEDEHGNVGTVPTKPVIVFTAGAMGAGKSYTINKLVENGRFPLEAFVIVDPDEIRRVLPEWLIYAQRSPERAGDLTRKEAGYIAEILTLAAMQSGKNVVVDGSLRDCDWYIEYFARLRKDYPHMQSIIHVTAPREAVLSRAAKRAETTGRIVPEETLLAALEQVPKSVNVLKDHVTFYAEISNPPDAPDVELVEPKGWTWSQFRSTWDQSLAFITDKQKVVAKQQKAKCKLHQVSSSLNVNGDCDAD
jgi:predicted kinase